ncbi:hypothetical protein ACIBU0_30750 [Streptomyces sp. NPDC049627]|uniref:hypothetical protein n=1 Tax=Streptomyces sp. NPDC049627 TaxID=3365595 RepID=UPI00378A57B5
MTEQKKDRGDRYDRARSDEEPGAHSGAESQARKRTVPGTASGTEGYQPERGTTAGKPLEGVEATEGTQGTRGESDGGGDPGRRRKAP